MRSQKNVKSTKILNEWNRQTSQTCKRCGENRRKGKKYIYLDSSSKMLGLCPYLHGILHVWSSCYKVGFVSDHFLFFLKNRLVYLYGFFSCKIFGSFPHRSTTLDLSVKGRSSYSVFSTRQSTPTC